jgi:hypothetical protein
MKKALKIFSLFCATVFIFSCQKQYSIFDESKIDGVYAAIDGAPSSVLFYYNTGTSSYKTNIKLHGPSKAQKMDTYVVVGGVETFVKSLTFPSTVWEVTLQDVATALNQPLTDFTPGAQIILRNKITSTDGQVWSADNTSNLSGGLLSGTAFQNLLADVTVFVTCPFVASDAVGNYHIVRDDWVDFNPGDPVTVSMIDATHIQINEYPATSYQHAPLVITIDPNSGAATVEKQYSGGYGSSQLEYSAGSGFVFSCVGYITVTLNFTVNGGAYNGYTLIVSK